MSHTVTLSVCRTAFEVQDNETILQAATRQGLNLPHSCQSGICGQCKAELKSGDVAQGGHSEQALSAAEEAEGKILMCCAKIRSDVEIEIPGYQGDLPSVRVSPARVNRVEYRADTAVLGLTLPKAPRFEFLAGQYIDIQTKNGTRSYSIASSSAESEHLELHIRKREGGMFTGLLFGDEPAIQEKTVMRIRGPLGAFTLRLHQGEPLIFLATGTGYAPVHSMLQQLAAQENRPEIHLYWGGRTLNDLYYFNEARELCEQIGARFTPVLSRARESWQGARGYVQQHALADYPDLSAHQVYACGSAQMITAAQELLTGQGRLKKENFFSDIFTPAA
ncbi:MAG: 2Fe-2S iron-sulfur cluster-binding protein [Neisseria sp.]|nr:2Fe-2S iron-sulfur cluster-binding protein [Neisseria sp.]